MSALRVVLQARTTSTRLPAKALLPLAGMPSSILAARRAARDGLDLVFATSEDPTDDALAALAAYAGLKVFRGSKDDVLGRYATATADMAEDDVVLRITGDDPVPDADFLRTLAQSRARQGVEMLFCHSPADGLPHGLAAQAFTVAALRRAAAQAVDPFDREHVGPWMVRNCTSAVFGDLAALDAGHLRCTLDTIDDYFDLQRLFEGVTDPVGTPWRALTDKLRTQSPWRGMPFRFLRGQPGGEDSVERLGVIVVDAGAGSVDILRRAIRCGASHIVTKPGPSARLAGIALAQGWSGRASVILRLPALPADVTRTRVADWVDATILDAMRDLGLVRLHTVLATPVPGARGAAQIEHLAQRRDEGWCRHLGIAGHNAAEARRWIKHSAVTHIELACGPDDFAARGLAAAMKSRPEVIVLARPINGETTDTALTAALAQTWAMGVVANIASPARLAALVDAARAARPRKG